MEASDSEGKFCSDPPPLIILILHGKRENRKTKKIRREQIDKACDVCFYLCKNFDIARDLKLSRAPMFFSKTKFHHNFQLLLFIKSIILVRF